MTETAASAPSITSLRRMFEEAQTLTQKSRDQMLIDQDYYDGKQWSSAEKAALDKRHQPDNVFNLTRLAINGTLGVVVQSQTDPRAFPRNPQDEDKADVATKTLRYLADRNRWTDVKEAGARGYLIQGTCAVIVEVDEEGVPSLGEIRTEEFFADPYSRRTDFKDARYMGMARWMYSDDVAGLYPDAKADLDGYLDGVASLSTDMSFMDRPETAGSLVAWSDGRRRRVLVVEIYHREGGTWKRTVFYGGGVLDHADSAYLDDKQRPTNPIEARSCYVDRENQRCGLVRDMRGPQDEVNKRHSKLLHLLTMRQVQETALGAGQGDVDDVRKEASRPDGVIPSGWQIAPTGDMAAGQQALLQEAKAFIERFAPNPAMLGRSGEDKSGRAKLVDQQAGLTELAPVFRGLEEWELRIYRAMWTRARQFMRQPMFVRVTDSEQRPEFVGVNQPVMGGAQVVMGPQGPMLQPTIQGYENALAELDMDISIETVPDTANLQSEQFNILAELAKVYPQQVTFDDLLELSTMPGKRALIEKRQTRAQEAAQQGPNPAEVIQMRGAEAKIAETEASAALKGAQARNEMMKPQIQALEALASSPAAGVTGAPAA